MCTKYWYICVPYHNFAQFRCRTRSRWSILSLQNGCNKINSCYLMSFPRTKRKHIIISSKLGILKHSQNKNTLRVFRLTHIIPVSWFWTFLTELSEPSNFYRIGFESMGISETPWPDKAVLHKPTCFVLTYLLVSSSFLRGRIVATNKTKANCKKCFYRLLSCIKSIFFKRK